MSYVYPNCVTVVLYNGGRVRLHPTQQWPDDDPFVQARPEFFSSTPLVAAHSEGYEPPVERATRAPGEKRATRRASRKTADDTADSTDQTGGDGE